MPSKSTPFTPSSILFRPRRMHRPRRWTWWSRRVLPPGPKGLLRRPFIAIAGLRRHRNIGAKWLPKKGRVGAAAGLRTFAVCAFTAESPCHADAQHPHSPRVLSAWVRMPHCAFWPCRSPLSSRSSSRPSWSPAAAIGSPVRSPIICAYALSLLLVERLFLIVKPKLLTLRWFAGRGIGSLRCGARCLAGSDSTACAGGGKAAGCAEIAGRPSLTLLAYPRTTCRATTARMKLLSGGQSGVDRAALDVAIERGVPLWRLVPEGWLGRGFSDSAGAAGGGTASPRVNHRSADPAQRTELNLCARGPHACLTIVDAGGLDVSAGDDPRTATSRTATASRSPPPRGEAR